MSKELYFSSGTSMFGISYSENLHPQPDSQDDNLFYVASSLLNISVDVVVNEHRLKEDGTLNLLQRQLENSPLWKCLMFSLLNDTQSEDPILKNSELHLTLRCNLFHAIIPDLAHASNVRFLQSLAIKYEYWSASRAIYFEDLFESLQYSLTSLVLNLEFRFPFIFSYYGKQLVKINYRNLLRNSTLLATPLDDASVPDHGAILATVLRKLHSATLYEFNTLNVMKECEFRSWQASSCRKYTKSPEIRKSIKMQGLDLRPLRDVLPPFEQVPGKY